jgi:hypothetical protein
MQGLRKELAKLQQEHAEAAWTVAQLQSQMEEQRETNAEKVCGMTLITP